MQLFIFQRVGSSIALAIVTLLVLSCTAVGISQYTERQAIINNHLSNHFIAEAMVEIASDEDTNFNCGRVIRLSQKEWLVKFKSGKQVKVTE